MKTILSALALALAGAAFAQAPAAQAPPAKPPAPRGTPSPCALTAGLEIGMSRGAAFEVMRFRAPQLKTENVKRYHHAPDKRGYTVDVTFASEAPDAKVTGLHYVFEPAGVFDALRERYGEPGAKQPAPGTWRWDASAKCGTVLTYHAMEDDHHQLKGEELTAEPAGPAKK